MKWNCPVGNIVQILLILQIFQILWHSTGVLPNNFSNSRVSFLACLLARKQTNYMRQAMQITLQILKAMPDRNLCLQGTIFFQLELIIPQNWRGLSFVSGCLPMQLSSKEEIIYLPSTTNYKILVYFVVGFCNN